MVLSIADIEVGDRVRFAVFQEDNFNGPNARNLVGICGTVTSITAALGRYVRVQWDVDFEAGGSFGRFNDHVFRPESLEFEGERPPVVEVDDSEVREVWY